MPLIPPAFATMANKEKWSSNVCSTLAITCYGVPVKGVARLEGSAREVADLLLGNKTEPSSDEIAQVVEELRRAGEKYRKRNGQEKEG